MYNNFRHRDFALKEEKLTIAEHEVFVRCWEVETPIANIFIAHGLGEHGGRYAHFSEHFNQLGYNVYAHDHRGHGKSSGKQGHIDSFAQYSLDLKSVIEKYGNNELPNYLLGHSLGGVIASAFLIRYPKLIERSIISAPGFEKKIPPNPIKAAIGKLLANITPKLTLWNEIEAEWICRSEKVVKDYENDPLVHDRVSAKFFTSFLAERAFIEKNVKMIRTPVLMIIPGSDLIVNHQVSKQVFAQIVSTKKLVEYPNAYHEILNEEKEKLEAYSEIAEWIAEK